MKSTVLIDASHIGHRAKHTTGGLVNGTIFGFLRDVGSLEEMGFGSLVVFAFDSHSSLRTHAYPGYKAARKKRHAEMTEDDKVAYRNYHVEMERLRTDILPRLGYRNIVMVDGYEADDVIAAYAEQTEDGRTCTIISGDADMWQCLRKNVSCYSLSSGRMTTLRDFQSKWGIEPRQWATVKAIAGCSGDDVAGIRGIGEKSAVAYLLKTLRPGKKLQSIIDGIDILEINMPLVKLPYPGLVVPPLVDNELSFDKQASILNELGIRDERAVARNLKPGFFQSHE